MQIDARQVYHSLCPLPPLSPVPRPGDADSIAEQQRNEAAYRQLLVQAVLALLLPTEDLENPCLTSLVGQIFSEIIIGNAAANKAAQPWLIWEGICILARVVQERKEKKDKMSSRLVGRSPAEDVDKASRRWSVHGFFLSIINLCILFVTSIRLVAGAVIASSSLPPRLPSSPDTKGTSATQSKAKIPSESNTHVAPIPAPILDFRIWSCAGNLLELTTRMPWLNGFLSLVQHAAINGPARLGRLDGPIDR